MAGFSKKKYLRLAKGFYGRSNNCLKIAIPKVEKALAKAYVGRKLRARNLKTSWIMTISAATRDLNFSYAPFIYGLNHSNLDLNRKILADLAINEPYSFKAVVDEIKVQNGYLQPQRITLQNLIRQNLITAARLKKQDYEPIPDKGVKVRY